MVRLVAAAVLLSWATPAGAGSLRHHVGLTLSGRLRAEAVDYFSPPPGSAPDGAERYGFLAHQLRLGVRATWAHWQFAIEGQDTRLVGLPPDASLSAPFGNLGPGATYFAHSRERNPGSTFLKQARATFRHSGFAASLGRFEISDGLETLPGDATISWLKRARLSERLVGPFGYTHGSRSFDGVRASYDGERINVTGFWSRPTRGGYELRAGGEFAGVRVSGGSINWKPGGPADIRLFYLAYRDNRTEPSKVDNRPAAARLLDSEPLRIETAGGHAAVARSMGPGTGDLLAWLAVQAGDWGLQRHRAWGLAVEGGYQLPRIPLSPWLRFGLDRGSGDDDPLDSRHETFFPLIPTPRLHAQFPFYNAMNDRDLFAQLILRLGVRTTLRIDYHSLGLSSRADLWYGGGGATHERFFGYSGIAAGGERRLADVVEVSVARRLRDKVDAYAYFARAHGRGVVARTFSGTRATYGYVELSYRY